MQRRMILDGMAKDASFQGFYRTSVVRLDYLLIVYSYFMTTRETVNLLSRVSGEDLRNLGQQFPRSSQSST